MSSAAAVLLLLSVQVVQGWDDWGVTYTSTEVCALKGSAVELSCTYSHPAPRNRKTNTVEKSFWFTKKENEEPVDVTTDSEYTGRVTSTCQEKRCTLRITDVRKSDSAEYKFRFITKTPGGRYSGEPGVFLSVRESSTDPGLQVTVIRYQYTSRKELKCVSGCPLPHSSYVWYKDGERIPEETSSSYSGQPYPVNSFSCALQELEDFPSPPVCVDEDWCNRVTYTNRRICAPKGSSVDVSCSYKSYGAITSKSWFRPGSSREWQSPSQVSDRVEVLEDWSGHSALRISDLREDDSAEYCFKFNSESSGWRSNSPGTTLTVTDLQVQVRERTAGESQTRAELSCQSSCSPLSYVWFRNGEKLTGEEASSYTGWVSVGEEITCAFKGHEGSPSLPVYAPKLPSVSVSPSGEIVEGRSLTLTCSTDANPAANYTWYKEDENQDLHPLGKGPELNFESIQSSDSGEFYCEAENELGKRTSERRTISVKYAPKLPSVSMSPSGEIVEGSSLTLTCSTDANPEANYTWYKEDEDSFLAKGPKFTITYVTATNSGNYSCEAENMLGSQRVSMHLVVLTDQFLLITNTIRLTLVVVIPLPVLLISLWMRKKTDLSSTTEPQEAAETMELESDPDYANASAAHSSSAEQTSRDSRV